MAATILKYLAVLVIGGAAANVAPVHSTVHHARPRAAATRTPRPPAPRTAASPAAGTTSSSP